MRLTRNWNGGAFVPKPSSMVKFGYTNPWLVGLEKIGMKTCINLPTGTGLASIFLNLMRPKARNLPSA